MDLRGGDRTQRLRGPDRVERGGRRRRRRARPSLFGSGRTLHALRADNGERGVEARGRHRRTRRLHRDRVVPGGRRRQGALRHRRAQPAGPAGRRGRARRRAPASVVWYFDPERGRPPSGCADVWSSPSVDLDRRPRVHRHRPTARHRPRAGAPTPRRSSPLDLDTGEPRWSLPAPRAQQRRPRLRRRAEPVPRRRTGTSSASATRTAPTTRSTATPGELVWKAEATGPGLDETGRNFSTGGFIGAHGLQPTASSSAAPPSGPAPYLHGDRRRAPATSSGSRTACRPPTRAAAVVNGVLFNGGNDFTLRAFDLTTGDGALAARDEGRGRRRPGGGRRQRVRGGRHPRAGARARDARTAASTGSSLPALGTSRSTTSRQLDRPPPAPRRRRTSCSSRPTQACVGSAVRSVHRPASRCAHRRPACTRRRRSRSTTDPFRVTVRGRRPRPTRSSGCRPGSPARRAGRHGVRAVHLRERRQPRRWGAVHPATRRYSCTGRLAPPADHATTASRSSPSNDAEPSPTPSDGPARLIVTTSFDPAADPGRPDHH